MITLSLTTAIAFAAAFGAGPARASASKRTIVLLDFGGEQAQDVRARILRFLKKNYNVYPGLKLVETCERLGLELKRGPNLATCARTLRAVAVVGGAVAGGRLNLAIYSGQTGETLHDGSVKWASPPTSSNISEALRLLASGLSRAPTAVEPPLRPGTTPPRPPPSAPPPAPAPAGEPKQQTAQPQPAAPPSGPAVSPMYDPSQIAPGDPAGAEGNPLDEIDPLGDLGGIGGGSDDTGVEGEAEEGRDYIEEGKPSPADKPVKTRRKGIEATVGLGTLLRNFATGRRTGWSTTSNTPNSQSPLEYDSGLAFAIRLGAMTRPLAFFRNDWTAGLFARLDGSLTLGLQAVPTTGGVKASTSITDISADLGWEWLIYEDPYTPRMTFSLGFALTDFSVAWPTSSLQSAQQIDDAGPDGDDAPATPAASRNPFPNFGYRSLFARIGGSYPFAEAFAAHASADYRFVIDSGEVEDEVLWFGDAFVGGFGAIAGVSFTHSGFIASFEYRLAFYFYSFAGDVNGRAQRSLQATGSATDMFNTFWLNAGYSF